MSTMSTKCGNCGLVNFAGVDACRRCGTALGAGAAPSWGGAPSASVWSGPAMQDGSSGYDSWQPGSTVNPGYGPPGNSYAAPYGGYAYARPYAELAGLGSRLGAALLDGACYTVPAVLGVVLGAALSRGAGGAGFAVGMLLAVLFILGVGVAQLVMLSSSGQTIGKRMVGIRIVRLDTGENGGFTTNVLMRGIVPMLIGMVPYLGPVFSLVDTLFIFKEDRRCIHDHIAGTMVVTA